MEKLLRRIINLFKKRKMAKINFLTAYPLATTPLSGNSILIGSLASGGDTKNFLLSDISAYVMSANTLTLQDVCDNGSVTTTGITVAGTTTLNGTVDINNTADISGNTTIGGTLGVTGVSTLGEIDASGVADIADTLTLSKATGTGLAVTADATIGGTAVIGNRVTINHTASSALVINGGIGTVISAATGTCVLNAILSNDIVVEDIIVTKTAPATASSTGIAGQIATDADYIYICTATDTWKRVAIATW
jgi:hypothetical protein